jgi:hypothetical protein
MMSRLFRGLRAAVAGVLVLGSTVLHVPVLLLVALLKALLPFTPLRRGFDRALMLIAENWIGLNSRMIDAFTHTRFQIEGLEDLRYGGHYLVLASNWRNGPNSRAATSPPPGAPARSSGTSRCR